MLRTVDEITDMGGQINLASGSNTIPFGYLPKFDFVGSIDVTLSAPGNGNISTGVLRLRVEGGQFSVSPYGVVGTTFPGTTVLFNSGTSISWIV